MTDCYQGLPEDCKAQLFDLAYGGATCNRAFVKPVYDHVKDFVQQVEQWINFVKPAVSWQAADTLAAVWFG